MFVCMDSIGLCVLCIEAYLLFICRLDGAIFILFIFMLYSIGIERCDHQNVKISIICYLCFLVINCMTFINRALKVFFNE